MSGELQADAPPEVAFDAEPDARPLPVSRGIVCVAVLVCATYWNGGEYVEV